jgi:excisionase family DNA binding protein
MEHGRRIHISGGPAQQAVLREGAGLDMPETREQNQVAEVLTLHEAASFLRVSVDALTELAERHALPARKIADEWRFSRRALEDWLRFPGLHPEDYWRVHPRWLLESPFAEEFLMILEKRLLVHLKHLEAVESSPKPGSKQAVLNRFGLIRDDDDLEEQLEKVRKWREAGG